MNIKGNTYVEKFTGVINQLQIGNDDMYGNLKIWLSDNLLLYTDGTTIYVKDNKGNILGQGRLLRSSINDILAVNTVAKFILSYSYGKTTSVLRITTWDDNYQFNNVDISVSTPSTIAKLNFCNGEYTDNSKIIYAIKNESVGVYYLQKYSLENDEFTLLSESKTDLPNGTYTGATWIHQHNCILVSNNNNGVDNLYGYLLNPEGRILYSSSTTAFRNICNIGYVGSTSNGLYSQSSFTIHDSILYKFAQTTYNYTKVTNLRLYTFNFSTFSLNTFELQTLVPICGVFYDSVSDKLYTYYKNSVDKISLAYVDVAQLKLVEVISNISDYYMYDSYHTAGFSTTITENYRFRASGFNMTGRTTAYNIITDLSLPHIEIAENNIYGILKHAVKQFDDATVYRLKDNNV